MIWPSIVGRLSRTLTLAAPASAAAAKLAPTSWRPAA